MASYNEIGYSILEVINNNKISDDESVSLEQIFFELAVQRNIWMEKTYNKQGRVIPRQVIQDLGCLELEEVDAADCCDINVGCTMLRTVKKLPQFLALHTGEAITRVGPVHKLHAPYTFTSLPKAILVSYEKYGSKIVQASLLNERMVLIITDPNMQMLTHINVAGIIANPLDAIAFRCDDGTACFSYDEQYPIPLSMLGYIKDHILNQFGVAARFATDDANNAKDS